VARIPCYLRDLTRLGLVLALVGALLGLGLIHDRALAADSPAPKRLTLVDRSPSELAFSWSPVKGAASYKVKMSTSSSMTKPIYAMSSYASEKISGLKAGQTYYAKVRVTDKKGVATPTPLAQPPISPGTCTSWVTTSRLGPSRRTPWPASAGCWARITSTLYEHARALHEDTLARIRRVLGDDHPDTRLSANNLAAVLRKLGETSQ